MVRAGRVIDFYDTSENILKNTQRIKKKILFFLKQMDNNNNKVSMSFVRTKKKQESSRRNFSHLKTENIGAVGFCEKIKKSILTRPE